jgi:hypothetical protein
MRHLMVESVYQFVRAFILEKGYPPLREEIAQGCNLGLPTVSLALDILETTGRLYGAAQPRMAMRLVEEPEALEIA